MKPPMFKPEEVENELSHAERVRQVERYRERIDNLGKPMPRPKKEEEVSGNEDQRFCRREVFNARNKYKRRTEIKW